MIRIGAAAVLATMLLISPADVVGGRSEIEAPAPEQELTEEDIQEEKYNDSLELLAQLVEAEAGNQDLIGKCLVVDVVLNRVDSPKFPDTITEVIYQKGQFSCINDGNFDKAGFQMKEDDYEAVRLELESRRDSEILFFTAGHYNPSGTPAYKHGAHYFSK